jgi:hypothetical protein
MVWWCGATKRELVEQVEERESKLLKDLTGGKAARNFRED